MKSRRKFSRRAAAITAAMLVTSVSAFSASAQFAPTQGGGFNPTQVVQSALGTLQGQIGGYLEQVNQIKSQVSGVLGGLTGELDGLIKDAIGSLGLPDLGKLREQISKTIGKGGSKSNDTNQLLNPVVVNSGTGLTKAIRPAVEAGLSTEAQQRASEGLKNISEKVAGVAVSQQASKTAAQGSATASQESQKMAQQATAQSKTAQGRVSTQDAIKDLNMTAALQSTQLSQVSTQLAGQSSQLGAITDQTAASVELQGIAAAHLNHLETGQSVANASLLNINDQLKGQEHAQIMRDNAAAGQLSEANSNGFRLMR